jgi:hypothetical protein
MPYAQGGTFTFGSDEGFDAVHEAMKNYINEPDRGAFHISLNLTDATMLINMLEFIMMHGALEVNEARAAGDEVSSRQAQVLLEWAERYYSSIASIVGVELV